MLIHPDYFRVVLRQDGKWILKKSRTFYNRLPIQVDFDDLRLLYGISEKQLASELFHLANGEAGYYLADLRHKQYYYCGIEPKSVKAKLLDLGIGCPDPVT
ncbi:hypothetical protein NIES2101_21760 [Calothrix sp. HK-06]|nr:hypothetical protein NIES2101_21760 [Calothrix sp. HK-06]